MLILCYISDQIMKQKYGTNIFLLQQGSVLRGLSFNLDL